ncbi:MAG: transcription antitermination factor NusB [Syntrophotaleaceae bacterium]
MQIGYRRQGRELAVKILYCFDQGAENMQAVLNLFWNNFRFSNDVLGEPLEDANAPVPSEARSFAEALAHGFYQHRDQIDRIIDEFSTNWSIERMAKVDLAILRMSCYEILFMPEVPTSVVINEAVEIGKRYGTGETPSFVNGLLDKISRIYRASSG